MKKIISFLISCFLIITLAYPQSLAEAAKKEKERREKLKKEGKQSKIITNEDINNVKQKVLGIEVPEGQQKPSESTTPVQEQATAEDEIKLQIKKQKEQLQAEIDRLKKQREEEQDRINRGAIYFGVNPGEAYQKIRELDEKIKDLENQLKTFENEEIQH